MRSNPLIETVKLRQAFAALVCGAALIFAGHSSAQNMLGTLFFSGQGVPKDFARAEIWWRKAAEQDYAAAQYNLGGMYSRQLSTTLTRDEALQWLGQAAAQGHARANLELAELESQPEQALVVSDAT